MGRGRGCVNAASACAVDGPPPLGLALLRMSSLAPLAGQPGSRTGRPRLPGRGRPVRAAGQAAVLAIAALLALDAGAAGARSDTPPPHPPSTSPPRPADALRADRGGPARDAVVSLGGCTGALVAPDLVLTAGHCLPVPHRAARPAGAAPHDCAALPDQARVQGAPWEDSDRWYATRIAPPVRVGPDAEAPLFRSRAVAYALPRCADMALLRLAEPVPPEVARPLPILTRAPLAGRLPRRTALRHVSFAPLPGARPGTAPRVTGPLLYWGENDCVLVALPPDRGDGRRLASGDSGAPLLMRDRDGREVVAGVLFVIGQPDRATCGTIAPSPHAQHGAWTPTWRPAPPGTAATDIGDWLRRMAPQALHR